MKVTYPSDTIFYYVGY